MSHGFVPVNWNRRKKIYDLAVWIGILGFVGLFLMVSKLLLQGDESISSVIILIRAFAACGFVMLTIILCIGPLARIDHRFLPLLYNRRHFGVSFFFVVLFHSALAIYWYHSFGAINPIVSVVVSGGTYESPGGIPFQMFGLLALLIFFVMATTSHDYWNALLGQMWKGLHVLIYPAYVLVVLHVSFGALQHDSTGFLSPLVFGSVALVGGLHLYAALFGAGNYVKIATVTDESEWVNVGSWKNILNNKAITVQIGNRERIAVFRFDDNKLCAVSNVCQHQNGPLGEGRIIDGCITCPWHGYQYRPEDGCSPPPFTEKIETYLLRLEGDCIILNPTALPKGTPRPIVEVN